MIRTMTTTMLTAAVLALGALVPATASAAPAAPDRAESRCGGTVFATPFKPGKESVGRCGIFGSPGHVQWYSWGVDSNSGGAACMEGWGFDQAHPKGRWFSLGCGKSGNAGVPWGNVLAAPRVRAQSLNVPLGCFVNWNI